MVSVCTTFTDRKYREARGSTVYHFSLHVLNHYVVEHLSCVYWTFILLFLTLPLYSFCLLSLGCPFCID